MSQTRAQAKEAIGAIKDHLRGLALKPAEGVLNIDESPYFATAPEGITPEVVGQVADHTANYVTAAHAIGGEIFVAAAQEDSTLESMTANISLAAMGTQTSSYEKATDYKVGDKEGTSYGNSRCNVTFTASNGGGQLSGEIKALKALAASTFGKD